MAQRFQECPAAGNRRIQLGPRNCRRDRNDFRRHGDYEARRSVSRIFYPRARHYPDDVKSKGKNGLYYLGDRKTYNSLGFNTSLVSVNDAPKSLKELLDPKWKGKMSIVSTSTGVRWIGSVLNT